MTGEELLYEVRDGVAWITLNRPEALNAIDEAQRLRVIAAFEQAEAAPEVAVIVLRAAGERAFSAGADQKAAHGFTSPDDYRATRRGRPFATRLDGFAKPTIAAVQGFCIGLGLELALACDLRVASEDARFSLPEVAVGLIPSSGVSKRLAAVVGLGRALEMVLTGRRVGAAEALAMGLVNRVVPPGELEAAASELAGAIAANAPLAVRYARERLRSGLDQSMADAVRAETDLLALLMVSEDRAEAAKAFREKRKPVFKGR